jgi:SNF2 family DNA or RNA helicase
MPDIQPYQLYPHQQEAIQKIEKHFENNINPVCALQPGKGKTIVACEIIQRFRALDLYNIAIIVKTVNISNPWIKELKACHIPYTLIHGKDREKKYVLNDSYLIKKGNVFITTHDTALIDIERILNMGDFDLIVYDELHTIINPKKLTQKSKLFACLVAKHKLALTATPVQNTINDIGLINILLNNSEKLKKIDIDNEKIEESILKAAVEDAINKEIVILCSENMNASNNIVSSGKVSQIIKKRIILSIPVYDEMQDMILNILGDINGDIDDYFLNDDEKDDENRNPRNFKKLMSFLSHPDSIYKNNSVDIPCLNCTKLDAVKIIVGCIPKKEKVIIFSQFIDVLYSYDKLFKDMGYGSLILIGKDKGKDVDRKLDQFKNIDSFKFLLTTIFKSSEGLNLETANHIIILEFWWNPQKIIQAMGRIDRINQTRNIFVYMLRYNKDGKAFKYEKYYYDTMENKIEYARKINPAQMDMPDKKEFKNQTTFDTEFQSYISDFIRQYKKVVVKKKKPINNQVAKSSSSNGSLHDKTTQPDKGEPSSSALQEAIFTHLAQKYLPEDHRFDDLDLTGGSLD